MSAEVRLAAFVEGSLPADSASSFLERIWTQQLPQILQLRKISRLIPISKKALVAMDPSLPRMSGAGEPLDALIARELKRDPFDAAIVAWDLAPPWDPDAEVCRWNESVSLYQFLSKSSALPATWVTHAKARFDEMSSRAIAKARARVPIVEPGAILTLCMIPEFERSLTFSEDGIKRSLNLRGKPLRRWPKWQTNDAGRENTLLLQRAILEGRRVNGREGVLRKIRGDMRTAKDEWGSYFLDQLCQDNETLEEFRRQPLAERLMELLGRV